MGAGKDVSLAVILVTLCPSHNLSQLQKWESLLSIMVGKFLEICVWRQTINVFLPKQI